MSSALIVNPSCKQAIVLYQTNITFKNLQEDPVILAASRKKSFHVSIEKERSKKLAANHKSFAAVLLICSLVLYFKAHSFHEDLSLSVSLSSLILLYNPTLLADLSTIPLVT